MDYAIEGAYRSGKYSGLITTVAAGTGTAGHLWAARWSVPAATQLLDKRRVAVLQRLRIRAKTIAGFTAAQEFQIALYKMTAYTAAHTGGSAVVAEKKLNTMPAPLLTQRIAAAAELTAGTHTIGTDPIGADSSAELAAAATVAKGSAEIFLSSEDLIQHPIELFDTGAAAEGLLLRNEILMGAGGTVRLTVEMDWLELQRYPVGTYNVAKAVI